MHCNIYQIYDKPITPGNWIDADHLSDCSLWGVVANQIDDVQDRSAELQTFGEWLKQHDLGILEGDTFILSEQVCTRFFADHYSGFRKAVAAAEGITEEQFINDYEEVRDLLSDLQQSFVNCYGDYISWDFGPLMPMEEFLRTAVPGKPYYMGGVCSYQF